VTRKFTAFVPASEACTSFVMQKTIGLGANFMHENWLAGLRRGLLRGTELSLHNSPHDGVLGFKDFAIPPRQSARRSGIGQSVWSSREELCAWKTREPACSMSLSASSCQNLVLRCATFVSLGPQRRRSPVSSSAGETRPCSERWCEFSWTIVDMLMRFYR